VRHPEVELRREHVGVARPVGEHLAEELLRAAARVDVGRVDEVDPDLERLRDARLRALAPDRAAVGHPRAERDLRDVEVARAELPRAHLCLHIGHASRVRAPYVEESLELAPGLRVALLRPVSAEALIDEEAFDEDEFLPYWAELWPSGIALARAVAARDVRGLRVLELGCGLGLPSLAAALGGADVLATDWALDAIALLRRNAT